MSSTLISGSTLSDAKFSRFSHDCLVDQLSLVQKSEEKSIQMKRWEDKCDGNEMYSNW